MKGLKNKVVIVAGASGGIGRAVVRLLARKCGATILAISRTAANIRPLMDEVKQFSPSSESVEADLVKASAWEDVISQALRRHRRIDVLVNCTGLIVPGAFDRLSLSDIERVVSTNVLSVMAGVRSVLPVMKRQREGRIVLIGSLGGILPMPYESLYSATKFALRGFGLSLAEELKGTGVTLSLVSPGPVGTRMLLTEAANERSTLAFAQSPLSPGDVAAAVLDNIRSPRRETVLPLVSGHAAILAGSFPSCFGTLYKVLNIVGGRRLRRYRRLHSYRSAEVLHA